jgi:hypothetical protein
LSSGDIHGIVVVDENGESWPGYAISQIQEPPYVVDLRAGLHFKEKGKLTAWIFVNNGKLTHPVRIHPELAGYSKMILMIVKLFEEFTEARGIGGKHGDRPGLG